MLVDCLATADTDEERAKCRERFQNGMKICKEARKICNEACG